MVNVDESPFLAVGTEVSAKYKGAFCEAKIRRISKVVKCKVQYSNGTVAFVSDDVVKGQLKIGATVEIKCNDKKDLVTATIQKLQDNSQYTVVFDDGDITTLKRSALVPKSGKHFPSSSTLDQLPLTHPEHISLPVRNSIVQGRRNRKPKKCSGESGKNETGIMEEKDIGKVVCVEANDKKKVRDNWFPGLIVAPTAQSLIKTNITEDYLVRSFKDGKYFTVPKKEITEFTKEIAARVENPTLKTAVEKAILYIDKDELPPHWDRDLLFGVDKSCIATDSEGIFDSDNSEEESIEEKDHFVAQLFKFMDDRGTPLNQAPLINEKDVDLYKLFKLVNNLGGFNKVSKSKQWKTVAQKIGHEQSLICVKQLYQQYLLSFEDFNRKLGCTMLSHPRGVRSRNRFSRSIIRDVDKSLPSTSTTNDKNKQSSSTKQESNEKKDKPEISAKDNDVFKDPVVKRTTKATKSEEKLLSKNNEESSKKGDKKKNDNTISTSRSRQSVKWNPDISEIKDIKTKKELKETSKREIKKEVVIEVKHNNNESLEDKKSEKKKNTRNLFGKSVRKPAAKKEKEKVVKVKPTETVLSSMRKMRSLKDHIKTIVKVMTPFKKSKRGTSNIRLETSNKAKQVEDLPKLTRSRSKEELPNKRKLSTLSENTASTTSSGLIVENQVKGKKSNDVSEKKKPVRKKKDDKVINNPVAIDVSIEKKLFEMDDSPVIMGDNLVVYYGDKQATTYEAKVLNVCDIEGELKYYVHYKGWNSRYDEWIDIKRIAYRANPEPGQENDADSTKSEPKNIDPKKLLTSTSRTRRSVTPSTSNVNPKKPPLVSTRPTRACTLIDRSLSVIDNSDSDSEYSGNLEPIKQYNKKTQQVVKSIKSVHDVIVKMESSETDIKKKTLYPKTYPSKEVLMQRNVPKKTKSCLFKIHDNKSEETETCEKVTLKPFDFSFDMPPPCKKPNTVNENVKAQNECETVDSVQNEPKISPIHYLSPKEKSEKHDQLTVSEGPKLFDDTMEDDKESSILLTNSNNAEIFFYQSSSENQEQVQLKITNDDNDLASTVEDKAGKLKISGTDFDLNKIRSEMKGLLPTSNSVDHVPYTESLKVDNENVIEVSKSIDKITEDVYEFKESEPGDLEILSSDNDDKNLKVVKHIEPPKLYNFEKTAEISNCTEPVSSTPEILTEKNGSVTPFESNINSVYAFDKNDEININENDHKKKSSILNEVNDDLVFDNETDSEANKPESLITSNITTYVTDTNKIEENSHNETCHIEDNISSIKDEVLDLCMKPPKSPPNNIFSMPESNETNEIILDDEDDDDESKLVIAENDKIETDYQIDTDLEIANEENSTNEQSEDKQTHSLPPLPPSIHHLSSINFKSSYTIKTDLPKDSDDESTTSCNESIQNALIQSFQTYSNFEIHPSNTKIYQTYFENNDDSTKSAFEFGSNSKSPTIDLEKTESINKSCVDDPLKNKKSPNYKMDNEKLRNKSEKSSSLVHPELQCREEILDEETLNHVIGSEYNQKISNFDIHKPSTSKGYFDSIHQLSSSKDSFYETDNSNDTKSSFFDTNQVDLVKSVIFDNCAPSINKSNILDDVPTTNSKDSFVDTKVSSTSNNSFYDNPTPGCSKSLCTPESDVNSVLFCEETIPGSPTGTPDDQFEQEEKKKTLAQTLFDVREAASAMYAMNQSFQRPMINLIGATEKEMEDYTNSIQNEGMHDQRHLQFLAEISSRNLVSNENKESSITESLQTESKSTGEQTVKSSEKLQTKRKTSSHEYPTSKRHKTSTVATTENNAERLSEIHIPLRDGRPLVSFTPDMDSPQRQAVILAKINELRKEYTIIRARMAVIDRRRKKIRKRKRELAKLAAMNQNKQSPVSTSK